MNSQQATAKSVADLTARIDALEALAASLESACNGSYPDLTASLASPPARMNLHALMALAINSLVYTPFWLFIPTHSLKNLSFITI